MKLKKIDFNSQKKMLDLVYLISENKKNKEVIKFNEKGIKNLISIYGTLNLINIPINNLTENEEWFNIISKGSNFILKITREYILHMLEVCPDNVNLEIDNLKEVSYDLKHYHMNDNLLEFSDEFVIDEINLLRNYEYGTFCLDRLSNEIFKDISKSDLDKFNKRIHRVNLNDFNEKILKRLSKNTPKDFIQEDYKLLLRLFKYQFNKDKLTPLVALDFSLDFKNQGLSYNNKLVKYKGIINKVLLNDLGRNKGLRK